MAHDQAAFGEPGNLDHPGAGGSRPDRWTVLPADSAVVDHLRRHRPVSRVGLLLVEAPTAQYQPRPALHDLFVHEELASLRAGQTRGREEVSLAPKGLRAATFQNILPFSRPCVGFYFAYETSSVPLCALL